MGNDDKFDVIIARIDRMEDKLDKSQEDINEIKNNTNLMRLDLDYLSRKVSVLELTVDKHEAINSLKFKEVSTSSHLLKERVNELELPRKSLNLFMRIITALGAIVALIFGVLKLR
jgi:predicted  nucleic acid-binding Zn-ribbon protein